MQGVSIKKKRYNVELFIQKLFSQQGQLLVKEAQELGDQIQAIRMESRNLSSCYSEARFPIKLNTLL